MAEDGGEVALLDLARRVAHWARGGEEVEAYLSRGRTTSVRAYQGEVEQLSSADSAGVGVRVVTGHRQGFAWTASLAEEGLAEALSEARDNAAFATPDDHVGLAQPDDTSVADLDLWSRELDDLPTPAKVDLALDLEARARAADPRIRHVEWANYGDVLGEVALASSTGLEAATRRTACHLAVLAVAGQDGDTQTGVGYSVGRGPRDLDPGLAATDAVTRSTRLLGARKVSSTRLTVVLDRRVTSSLLGVLATALSGEAVLKGRSLFADRLGEEVADPGLTLVDDPTDPAAYGAATHDAEGLACRRNLLIGDGVLRGFLYDTYTGRRAALASTGSAVRGGFRTAPGVGCRALALVPGALTQDDVLAEVGEGLLVQSVTGMHSGVNPVSGDVSVGAEGLMIRGGALAEPVREVTIASTLQRMLGQVRTVGADLEWLPGVAAGVTLAVDGISLSGS